MSSRTDGASRAVTSNQRSIHPRLPALLARHRNSAFERPVAAHAGAALARIDAARAVHPGALILDSGCGSGESTRALAQQHPDALVIGVDKSAARLARASHHDKAPNLLFVRLDLRDCWTHLAACRVRLAAHYLLYPNPWPKQHQLMRRWHAHPLMPVLLGLGGTLELRTNWQLYAAEFAFSVRHLTDTAATVEAWQPEAPISAFERKYKAAGQPLYRVRIAAR